MTRPIAPKQPDAAIDTLARTLWGEARGESERGMEAVACVIMNRVNKPCWWGRDVIGVCRAPYQFSCWNPNDPNRRKLLAVDAQDMAFRVAQEIAGEAVRGELADITGGATHYFAASIPPPPWARRAKFTARIGGHLFYRDVP